MNQMCKLSKNIFNILLQARRGVLLLVFIACGLGMFAQSKMSDEQVIEYAMKEQKAGASQSQIVTKLMQKGVNIQQIRRVKRLYERSSGTLVSTTPDKVGTTTSAGVNRMRDSSFGMIEEIAPLSHRMMGDTLITNAKELTLDENENGNGKRVFGRDVFNKKNLTFEPNMNIATPQNYRLGAGDKVYVDVYGATQKTIEAVVAPDGTVTIEGYGPVTVAGLTVDEANARLRQTLGARYASSKVKLTVGQTRTIMVNVMGEVRAPGTYTLSAFATVFHALYMAGGTNELGTLRNIKVYRQGRLVSHVDVYDYILNGKLTGNVRLTDNDVIVVGTYDCLVNITGKVKRPMYYEMKKSESMQSLLRYAGGFASDAYTQSVRVIRKTGRQYSVHNVTEFDMSSFLVADGDSVSVDSILNRYENMVELKGAVFRPGMYQLGKDVNSVVSLLKMAEGVTEDAYTVRGIIHRMKKDRTLEVIAVDVEGMMNGTVADIPLQNEDVLFIPTKSSALEDRTLTIHGEVMCPGIYIYAENETLEDLVLQAGGLKESASVMKVDVARRVYDPKALTTKKDLARTYTFELQDGFVVKGESAFKLEPYDEVYVRKNPSYSKLQNVTVEGQVNFSGTYTLTKKGVRLSDVIESAGGVTSEAYVKGTRLERRLTDDERTRIKDMLKLAKNNSGKKDSIDVEKLDMSETYNVAIDLEKALANRGSSYDIVLREGDRLTVPEYNGTVKVNGAVMHSNTISYVEGKSAQWYIKHAGGLNSMAKRSKAYIIHQSGMVEELKSSVKVTPGAEIVVPEKNMRDKVSTAQYIAYGTGFASIATMIATIASLWK